MSKLKCVCGYLISNVKYPSPTEGEIICQQNDYAVFESASKEVVSFLASMKSNQRNQWLSNNFGDDYPLEISDEKIVYDIITKHFWPATKSICECESCGRLHVQKNVGENFYFSFAPDHSGYHAILQES